MDLLIAQALEEPQGLFNKRNQVFLVEDCLDGEDISTSYSRDKDDGLGSAAGVDFVLRQDFWLFGTGDLQIDHFPDGPNGQIMRERHHVDKKVILAEQVATGVVGCGGKLKCVFVYQTERKAMV
jgi:hypothetical protein